MVGSGKGWSCSADDLYLIFRAKYLTEGDRVVNEGTFRTILEDLGFPLLQSRDGSYFYDHMKYKDQDQEDRLDPIKTEKFELFWDNQFYLVKGRVGHNEAQELYEIED